MTLLQRLVAKQYPLTPVKASSLAEAMVEPMAKVFGEVMVAGVTVGK